MSEFPEGVPAGPLLKAESTKLHAEFTGLPIIVKERVARGGQGELYRAVMAGEQYAVKWYFPRTIVVDPRLLERLRNARDRGAPGANSKDQVTHTISKRFLWPVDVVTAEKMPGQFGYIMPWREARFVDFEGVLTQKVRVQPSFRSLATAAIETAAAFNNLHADGLCYKDISPGNIALDPDSGEVRICDNDNVDVNNVEIKIDVDGGVAGTTGFMAPEIVHEYMIKRTAHPNRDTDQWSLAVLLFWLFVRDDPLDGARGGGLFDEYAIYGPDARFVWDENDDSNRPVPGLHENAIRLWPVLPLFLQRLFLKAFTDGIRDPKKRVFETDWRKAMVRLRDAIFTCPNCGTENFYDGEANMHASCWAKSCRKPLPRPLLLNLAKSKSGVVMAPDAVLFPHHLDPQRSFDFSNCLAKVVRLPDHSGVIGLKNLGNQPWQIAFDGRQCSIGPRSTVVVLPGLHISFGQIEGVVS